MQSRRTARKGLCLVFFCAVVLLAPTALAYGEWHLQINGENAYPGDPCPTMDGSDYIYGTLHWPSSGVSFQYTYDTNRGWKDVGPTAWSPTYEVYLFDFTTSWSGSLIEFRIRASDANIPNFYCTM